MTRVSLMKVVFSVLLIFSHWSFHGTYVRALKCQSRARIEHKLDQFYQRKGMFPELPTNLHKRTCEQVSREMKADQRHRSLSPWTYRVYHNETLPFIMVMAECLCEGCIVDQREDMRYNSVPVLAPFLVLKKSRCERDANKYTIERVIIKIPVACTCVTPRYN